MLTEHENVGVAFGIFCYLVQKLRYCVTLTNYHRNFFSRPIMLGNQVELQTSKDGSVSQGLTFNDSIRHTIVESIRMPWVT